MKSLFPESLKSTQLVVYIRTINGSSVLVPAVEQFTMDLNRTLYELAPSPGFVREVEGYYLLRAMGLPAPALQKFVSKDGAATMIVFEIAAYAVGKPGRWLRGLGVHPYGRMCDVHPIPQHKTMQQR